MQLPTDLHTFLLLIGGPAALMFIVSHLLERNARFQALSVEAKAWIVLTLAIVLAFVSYGLAIWETGTIVTVTPQLIYTIALSGVTNWMSSQFYHNIFDATNPPSPDNTPATKTPATDNSKG